MRKKKRVALGSFEEKCKTKWQPPCKSCAQLRTQLAERDALVQELVGALEPLAKFADEKSNYIAHDDAIRAKKTLARARGVMEGK